MRNSVWGLFPIHHLPLPDLLSPLIMGIHLPTPQKSLYVGFASEGYVLEGFNPPKMGFPSVRDPLLGGSHYEGWR